MMQIAPPPMEPVETGSAAKWLSVEVQLSTSLPSDYKWLIDTYGSGDFCDMLVLLNPFAESDNTNMNCQLNAVFSDYQDYKEIFPENCPYPSFPEANGLLPVAHDTNGNDLFWITDGPPDSWELIHYNWRGGCLTQRYHSTLVQFMINWINGSLPDSFFGRGNSLKIIRKTPIFFPVLK